MDNKKRIRGILLSPESTMLYALIVLYIVCAFLSPYFLTVSNIMNILMYSSITGIVSVGMTMIILVGAIDISVGSIIGLVGMLSAIVLTATKNLFLAILVGLVIGLVCGTINGFLVTKVKMVPMIATLSGMSIYRGIAMLTTGGLSRVITDKVYISFGRGYVFNVIPVCAVVMIAIFIIAGYVLKYTTFGRRIYAIGGNPEASRLAGINVINTKMIVYIICGLLSALAGILTAAQTGAAIPMAGEALEMDAIASVVLGGTSMQGGKGNVRGTLIGVLIMTTLSNVLTLLGVLSFWQDVAKGLVLILAVAIDVGRNGGYKSK